MLTGVNRSLDPASAPYLHRSAYTGGVDARGGSWPVRGVGLARSEPGGRRCPRRSPGPSRIRFTSTSVRTARWSSTRPGPRSPASNGELRFAKVGGRRLHFETAYQRRTPGFEINDIGFLRQADHSSGPPGPTWPFNTAQPGLPAAPVELQQLGILDQSRGCPPSGPSTPTCTSSSPIDGGCTWAAPWASSAPPTATAAREVARRCGRITYVSPWIAIQGDDRRPSVPPCRQLQPGATRAGRRRSKCRRSSTSRSPAGSPPRSARPSTRTGTTSSTSARSPIRAASALHVRAPRAADTEPHLAAGLYLHADHVAPGLRVAVRLQRDLLDIREVAEARASCVRRRYRPYGDPAVTSDPGGFNFQQFRSNVVFRWEYRPGSTLFLVWSQGREGTSSVEGTDTFRGDLGDLFGRRADDSLPGQGVVLAHALRRSRRRRRDSSHRRSDA